MEGKKKISLSEITEYELDGRVVKVHPISLEGVIDVSSMLKELETETDMKKQVDIMADAVLLVLQDYNTITKAEIKKFPLKAALIIIQTACGQMNSIGNDSTVIA
ncbi:hypothetical protein LCGC14_0306070 [marine sediment metagenome]|uniref:Phage tail assembly protein n=1 Tax=marine sediment metagenome TaxID=412755 RepID=A0A0F9WV61_9ZZZZ